MTMPVAVFMALVALAAAPHHHARLAPSSFEPLQVRGTGFRAYERVRVSVTPSAGEAISHRVRATRRGGFVVSFAGRGGLRRHRRRGHRQPWQPRLISVLKPDC